MTHQDPSLSGPALPTAAALDNDVFYEPDASNPYRSANPYEHTSAIAPDPALWASTPSRRPWAVPLLLFLATIASTFWIFFPFPFFAESDTREELTTAFCQGLMYSGAIMFILTAHELGHFFQALRYRVPASYPYFIPMPFCPIGTMGAFIVLRGHMGNRKTLFDIGISGPLAGLVPALILTVVGIQWSEVAPTLAVPRAMLGVPLLYDWLAEWIKGPIPAGYYLKMHPLAFAGWVGFLITSLNLFPVGQLDGGHVLYAILRRKSYPVAVMVIACAALGMALTGAYQLFPMLLLVIWMRPFHPPTANDDEPLGAGRVALGLATLMFLFVGFTPTPFLFAGPN